MIAFLKTTRLVTEYDADILSNVTYQLMEVQQHFSYVRRDRAFPRVVFRSQIRVELYEKRSEIQNPRATQSIHHRLDELQDSLKSSMHPLARQGQNPLTSGRKLDKISHNRQQRATTRTHQRYGLPATYIHWCNHSFRMRDLHPQHRREDSFQE
jgi:hypothetical protein